jgi:hypothetical protein
LNWPPEGQGRISPALATATMATIQKGQSKISQAAAECGDWGLSTRNSISSHQLDDPEGGFRWQQSVSNICNHLFLGASVLGSARVFLSSLPDLPVDKPHGQDSELHKRNRALHAYSGCPLCRYYTCHHARTWGDPRPAHAVTATCILQHLLVCLQVYVYTRTYAHTWCTRTRTRPSVRTC